jgi:hypothetical protein
VNLVLIQLVDFSSHDYLQNIAVLTVETFTPRFTLPNASACPNVGHSAD